MEAAATAKTKPRRAHSTTCVMVELEPKLLRAGGATGTHLCRDDGTREAGEQHPGGLQGGRGWRKLAASMTGGRRQAETALDPSFIVLAVR